MPDETRPMTRPSARGLVSKREDILRAALEVFVLRGFADTSLDEVASKAGVSRQTIYNHFRDKDELFLVVIEQELKATLGLLQGASVAVEAAHADAPSYLLQLARQVLDIFMRPRTASLRLLIQSEAPRRPELMQLWRQHSASPVWSPLIGHLVQFNNLGELRIADPGRAAGQFVTLVTGSVWQMTELGTFAAVDPMQVDPGVIDTTLRENVALFVRGYRPTPDAPRS